MKLQAVKQTAAANVYVEKIIPVPLNRPGWRWLVRRILLTHLTGTGNSGVSHVSRKTESALVQSVADKWVVGVHYSDPAAADSVAPQGTAHYFRMWVVDGLLEESKPGQGAQNLYWGCQSMEANCWFSICLNLEEVRVDD